MKEYIYTSTLPLGPCGVKPYTHYNTLDRTQITDISILRRNFLS